MLSIHNIAKANAIKLFLYRHDNIFMDLQRSSCVIIDDANINKDNDEFYFGY